MQNQIGRYIVIARRWGWMIVLGVLVCGGITFIVSRLMHPVYQASTTLIVNLNTSPSGNATASLAVVPTYAQLVTNSLVLGPVVDKYPGMTLQELNDMITIKPQANTQLIELDVQNTNPQLAVQLANDISQSFAQYSNSQLPATIQIVPAQLPTDPVKPKPLQYAGIASLVGFAIAITLIIIFEWIDDRPSSLERVQEILGMEILANIPPFIQKQSKKIPTRQSAVLEKFRLFCASLHAIQQIRPFKLVMVTSPMAGEGKSTIASYISTFLALSGKRVLLVDANLRHPTQDQHFHLYNDRGLSSVFLEMWSSPRVELYGQETDIGTLRVLTSGPVPSKPAELLQSQLASQLFEYFKAASFDYIIFDSPPLLPVADARIIASYVEAVVLVTDTNKTSCRMLLRAKHVLARTRTTVLGIAINKSPWRDFEGVQQYPVKTQKTQIEMNLPMSISPNASYLPTEIAAEQHAENSDSAYVNNSYTIGHRQQLYNGDGFTPPPINTPVPPPGNIPTPLRLKKSNMLIRPPLIDYNQANHSNTFLPYPQRGIQNE